MITSKPSLRSGFDCIIRPAPSGAGRTTPSQPGHYPLIINRQRRVYVYFRCRHAHNIALYWINLNKHCRLDNFIEKFEKKCLQLLCLFRERCQGSPSEICCCDNLVFSGDKTLFICLWTVFWRANAHHTGDGRRTYMTYNIFRKLCIRLSGAPFTNMD